MTTICIPSPPAGIGGPASFIRRLTAVFTQLDIKVIENPTNEPIDAVLVVQSTRNLRWLLAQKRRGIPIVQRLNGIKGLSEQPGITSRHYWNNWVRNSTTNLIRRHIASSVIYQSKFSRRIWTDQFGTTNAETSVVYNGSDIRLSSNQRAQRPSGAPPVILAIEGGLDIPGILGKVSGIAEALSRQEFPVEFRIAGRLDNSLQAKIRQFSSINYLGTLSPAEVQTEMENADVFVSLENLPPCPNVVIEAMATALPVVGFNSGSLKELVEDDSMIVGAESSYPNPTINDFDLLADAITHSIQHRESLSSYVHDRAKNKFDIELIGQAYAEVLRG